jgi:hypothetical protein
MDLEKLIRLMKPLMISGVLSARKNSADRLAEKLEQLDFVTRNVTQTNKETIIELQILDPELLHRLLAGEANKFLLASRVSHERSKQVQSENVSWQAVEHYYAAYYGVHYLLRLTGVSITNLDQNSVRCIERNCLSGPVVVPKGLYVMFFDSSSNILILKKNTSKSGGSHIEAWQLWMELIEKICLEANSDIDEYARLSIELLEHKSFLIRSTGQFNPPSIRGEINYQFKGGVWIFERNSKDTINRLKRSIGATDSAALNINPTPDGLVDNNKIIINLARRVFIYASESYPKSICRSIAHKYSDYVY